MNKSARKLLVTTAVAIGIIYAGVWRAEADSLYAQTNLVSDIPGLAALIGEAGVGAADYRALADCSRRDHGCHVIALGRVLIRWALAECPLNTGGRAKSKFLSVISIHSI
jgi:hypothetical protein